MTRQPFVMATPLNPGRPGISIIAIRRMSVLFAGIGGAGMAGVCGLMMGSGVATRGCEDPSTAGWGLEMAGAVALCCDHAPSGSNNKQVIGNRLDLRMMISNGEGKRNRSCLTSGWDATTTALSCQYLGVELR